MRLTRVHSGVGITQVKCPNERPPFLVLFTFKIPHLDDKMDLNKSLSVSDLSLGSDSASIQS